MRLFSENEEVLRGSFLQRTATQHSTTLSLTGLLPVTDATGMVVRLVSVQEREGDAMPMAA